MAHTFYQASAGPCGTSTISFYPPDKKLSLRPLQILSQTADSRGPRIIGGGGDIQEGGALRSGEEGFGEGAAGALPVGVGNGGGIEGDCEHRGDEAAAFGEAFG